MNAANNGGVLQRRRVAGAAGRDRRARGRTGGRPKSLDEADLAAARALLADPDIPVAEVARRLKVNQATLYRYFPGGRAGLADREDTA